MRKILKNFKPRIVTYWSYKHFSIETYRESLLHQLPEEINILNTHAPCKRKHARGT